MRAEYALTDEQKRRRVKCCTDLLKRFARPSYRSIVFTDETYFTVEQSFNRQNDRIWSKKAPTRDERIIPRAMKAKGAMAHLAFTYDAKFPIIWVPQGLKINSAIYREEV
jgi:hypothetical protein